jgi:vitamin B12 transporter
VNKTISGKIATICFRRWTRKRFAVFASLHKVIKISVVTFTCSLVQLNYEPILAEARDSTGQVGQIDLDEIEISADQPVPWAGNAGFVQMTEQREINASPSRSLDNILETLAGLDVRQRGNDGIQADLSIRGGTFDQVLILLNGINITDPQTGHFNLDVPVDLESIRRIEVLQGSSARIWGPDAYSGVINLVTEPEAFNRGKRLKTHFSYGSYGHFSGNGIFDFNGNNWHSRFSISRKQSDGYRKNTDYDLFNTHFQTSFTSTGGDHFLFQAGYQQKAFGANSFYSLAYPNQFEQTKTLFTALNWQKKIGKTVLSALGSQRIHHDRFELFRNAENAAAWYTGHNYHLTSVTSGNLLLVQQNHLGKTYVGIDFRNEHILSNVLGLIKATPSADPFDESGIFTKSKNRSNGRLFADQRVYLGDWTLAGGLSGNLNSDFGTYFTGGIDVGYRLTENLQCQFNWNKAYRLPTFTDLYYQSATQISNPDLKPEQSFTYETGVKYENGHIKASFTAFYRLGENTIDWVKQPDSIKWMCRNETVINATGADLMVEYRNLKGLIKGLQLSYSALNMDKKASGYDSKYALDYLRRKINLRLEHRILETKTVGSITATWNLSHQDRAGSYSDFSTGILTEYEPFSLFDLRLNWQKEKIGIHLDGMNLFDVRYADFGGLDQPGLSLYLGIHLTL